MLPRTPACTPWSATSRLWPRFWTGWAWNGLPGLGYSLGGRVALSAAVALPERTTALVLESASPGIASEEERQQRIREDEALACWIEDVGVQRFVEYWESLPLWHSQKRLPAVMRDGLRSQRLRNNPCGLANSLRGVGTGAQPPLHDRLGEITVQVLLVAGEEDQKFTGIAREMRQAIPTSRLETVAEAGHAVHLEQPEIFEGAVTGFLEGVLTPAASR